MKYAVVSKIKIKRITIMTDAIEKCTFPILNVSMKFGTSGPEAGILEVYTSWACPCPDAKGFV